MADKKIQEKSRKPLLLLKEEELLAEEVKKSPSLNSIIIDYIHQVFSCFQKQPPRGVPRKRCSKNMHEIYRRTPMPKCDFNKVAKQLY